MYLISANSQHFLRRTGSFATRASATGRNLLGWEQGKDEPLTPEQRYEALKMHVNRLIELNDQHKKVPNPPLDLIKENKGRIHLALTEMRILRPVIGKKREYSDNIRDFIFAALKEKIGSKEFEKLKQEAMTRMREQASQAPTKKLGPSMV